MAVTRLTGSNWTNISGGHVSNDVANALANMTSKLLVRLHENSVSNARETLRLVSSITRILDIEHLPISINRLCVMAA